MGRDGTEVIGFAGVIGGVVPRAGVEGGVADALERWAAGEEGVSPHNSLSSSSISHFGDSLRGF